MLSPVVIIGVCQTAQAKHARAIQTSLRIESSKRQPAKSRSTILAKSPRLQLIHPRIPML